MTTTEIKVDFTPSGNSRQHIAGGWYAAEPDGTWTEGYTATVRLPRPPGLGATRCQVLLRPFVDERGPDSQAFTIEIGRQRVHTAEITDITRLDFSVPDHLLRGAEAVELTFRIPGATAPAALGVSTDVRMLGLCVREIVLVSETARSDNRPLSAPPRVAAVTMVYNEPEFLPIWLRHYSRHVGAENCFVVDHGTDDGSTNAMLGANRIRIPRSPYDPHKQSEWNSEFCSSLLAWYDAVIYSDVDEILLPDPRIAPSLQDYCRRNLPPVVNAIGLNTIHRFDSEAALDLSRPITEQRRYAFFCSPACKPLLIRRKTLWSPGSHSADAPVAFDHLYNFHLRWFDLPIGLRRLHRSRAMDWARTDAGAHARVDDETFTASYRGFAALAPRDDVAFDPAISPMADWLSRVTASQIGREAATYRISLDIWPDSLWRLPDRFIGTF